MVPSQAMNKRKPEDTNPLLAAFAKKVKKDGKAVSGSKRKLLSEEPTNNLLVVRHSETPPPQAESSRTDSRFSSQPANPPSKKFKAGSVAPPTSQHDGAKSGKRNATPLASIPDDREVDNQVRAMDDETDILRRKSRMNSIDPALRIQPQSTLTSKTRPTPTQTKTKPKTKPKFIDSVVPLPEGDTPQIERNKKLREGAMAAIRADRDTSPSEATSRRKSTGGRGKRISSSFENSGIITQPHSNVSDSSFYKHIDSDLPDVERLRQLLIWSSYRSAATSQAAASSSKSSTLPRLSAKASRALKAAQEEVIRMLAERKIDISVSSHSGARSTPSEELRENEQNVRNRQWHLKYTNQIHQAQMEEEAWKKASYTYEAYTKKLSSTAEKRTAYVKADPQTLSAKAKGKRRATADARDLDLVFPSENELPHEFHRALALSRSVLGYQTESDDRMAADKDTAERSSRTGMTSREMEAEIRRRLPMVEHKLDQLYSHLNSARLATSMAEQLLNDRFAVLSSNLASRANPRPPLGTESGAAQLVDTFISPSGVTRSSGPTLPSIPNPLHLLRALARVDTSRPPSKVSDDARQAAREVQRAGESGAIPVGDRRVTGIPPSTPRKGLLPPGTPRRGTTPGRDYR